MSIIYLINHGQVMSKIHHCMVKVLWSAACDRLQHPEGIRSNACASSLPVLLSNARAVGAGQAPRGSRRPALPADWGGLDCSSLCCWGRQAGCASHPSFPARCHGCGRPLWWHSQEACGNLRSPRLLQVLRKVSSHGQCCCSSWWGLSQILIEDPDDYTCRSQMSGLGSLKESPPQVLAKVGLILTCESVT